MSRLCQVISNAMLLAAFALSPSLVVAQAMILHLPLDAVDESGAFTVTSDGVAGPQPVAGKNGQAMHFQGKSALGIPFDFNFRKYPQVTVTAWVKQDVGASNSRAILSSASPKGLMLSVNGGRAVLVPGTGGLSYPAPMPFNEWVFIAGVVDMNTGRASLYQDGGDAVVKDGIVMINDDASKFGDPNDANAPKQPFLVVGAGKFSPWLTVERSMAIDDVRLYASALTREQIDAIRNNSASVQTTTPENIGETEKNDPGADESVTIGTPSTPKMPYDTSTPTTPINDTSKSTATDVTSSSDKVAIPGAAVPIEKSADNRLADATVPAVTAPTGKVAIPSATEQIKKSADNALPDAPRPVVTAPSGKVAMPDAQESIGRSQNEALPEGKATAPNEDAATNAPQQRVAAAQSGGEPYAVGDISEAQFSAIAGYQGESTEILDLGARFLTLIGWGERGDVPCRITPSSRETGTRDRLSRTSKRCGKNSNNSDSDPSLVKLYESVITSIDVCSSSSTRMKGIRIAGDRVNQDGSIKNILETDQAEKPNCNSWSGPKLCPSNRVASGLVVHWAESSGTKEMIVGLQLICRTIGVK